jgi:hypothetical protein
MLYLTPASAPCKNNERNHLARIRRQAKKRGFRIVRDSCGGFSLIDVKVEPPRPLLGCDHQQLWTIEQVVFTPLPEPPPRRKRMARLAEPAPVVSTIPAAAPPAAPVETASPAHGQAHHSFLSLLEALRAKGGAL